MVIEVILHDNNYNFTDFALIMRCMQLAFQVKWNLSIIIVDTLKASLVCKFNFWMGYGGTIIRTIIIETKFAAGISGCERQHDEGSAVELDCRNTTSRNSLKYWPVEFEVLKNVSNACTWWYLHPSICPDARPDKLTYFGCPPSTTTTTNLTYSKPEYTSNNLGVCSTANYKHVHGYVLA